MLRIISPPLGKIRPRIKIFITMERREIFDIEDVAHVVLVAWEIDLVCIVVLACASTLKGPSARGRILDLRLLGKRSF